jgi:hypothetical protein
VKQNLSFSCAERSKNAGSEGAPDEQLVDGDDELGFLEQLRMQGMLHQIIY